ncbi:MAG: CapA family protein [Planctomycetes bacterium]|nr:CapA family protein [Planctomycetota bacterium]
MIRILLGGDIYPAGRIFNAFVNGSAPEIFNNLLEELSTADLSIANLECPLITQSTAIDKDGPVLGTSTQCIKGFVASKWTALNLANNHSFDHGSVGLLETIRTITGAGLGVLGAGMNLEQAMTPMISIINGQRIVIYAMAEHEFSVASVGTPGANPLDLLNFVNVIRRSKQQGIFIVLIHGGKEYYPYPSPEMVRRCRFMVDMGADAVVCCHTHCPLPWEIYKDRPIIYGLGNLIFESRTQNPDQWYQGYLARLTIMDGGISFEPIPYYQSKDQIGVRQMNPVERDDFLVKMAIRNAKIKDEALIRDLWSELCRRQRGDYLSTLFGYNRVMCKLSGILLKMLHSKNDVLRALNSVQCETHREMLEGILDYEKKTCRS